MAKLSEQPISATITGGYVHIIMPNPAKPTGFESKRIKLEDFIYGGALASVSTDDTITGDGTSLDPLSIQDSIDDIQGVIDDTVYSIGIALAQLDKNIAVVAGVAKFPFPENATLTEVFVRLATAPTGANAIFDINVSASSILTNKIVIEADEYSSLDAATQPSFSDAVVDKGEAVTVDCDQIGATVAGQNPILIINYKKR
jgi:hypothetical protein